MGEALADYADPLYFRREINPELDEEIKKGEAPPCAYTDSPTYKKELEKSLKEKP